MSGVATLPSRQSSFAGNLAKETFSIFVGALFTLGLFVAMAYFELPGKKSAPEVVQELHAVSIPLDMPPPPLVQPDSQPEGATVTGIDVAAAESPVHIAVSLPVLDSLKVPLAPPAIIRTSSFTVDFKPKMDLTNDVNHVFQQDEVDRKPFVVVNTNPYIPNVVRNNADTLRVVLLMIVDTNGSAIDIRILKPSGNFRFDEIIVSCVRDEWVFSPAVKRGKTVKCLVQREIKVTWSSSHFGI